MLTHIFQICNIWIVKLKHSVFKKQGEIGNEAENPTISCFFF